MTMQAARYYGSGDVRVETVPVPVPGPGEALIAVGACGVCGSDAAEFSHGPLFTQGLVAGHPVSGARLPVVLGHEFAGTVVSVGPDVTDDWVGRVVCCGAGVSCGACRNCRAGRTNLCSAYYTLGLHADGGLAEFVVAPTATLADAGSLGLTVDAAALGQPMAIAVHSVARGRLEGGRTAVVVGLGGIGLFIAYAATAAGADVVAIDVNPDRLPLARALGADLTLTVENGACLAETVHALGREADVVFEATGRPEVLRDCLDLLAPAGRLVAVGVQKGASDQSLRNVTVHEQEIVGTSAHVCGRDLPRALELIAARPAGWSDVAGSVLPLSELVSGGLEPLSSGRATMTKMLFDPRIRETRLADYGVAHASRGIDG
jgi:(R,R)-butanediol dehydrogenase/meso-butanediol dehydrogenase/diacetyl reductase